jgi:hypothetical protein
VWRLLGVDAGLRRAARSFGPPATLIILLGLLTFAPACAHAVSPDAAEEICGLCHRSAESQAPDFHARAAILKTSGR